MTEIAQKVQKPQALKTVTSFESWNNKGLRRDRSYRGKDNILDLDVSVLYNVYGAVIDHKKR